MFFSSHKDRQQNILYSRTGNIYRFLIRLELKQKRGGGGEGGGEREREDDRYKKGGIIRSFS